MKTYRTRCHPIFSDEDADLRLVKWTTNQYGYAKRKVRIGGQVKTEFAHRVVLKRIVGRELTAKDVCDHKNFVPLDNSRSNLRLVTGKQNSQHKQPKGACGIRGVTFHKKCGKWQAMVTADRKVHYCGLHATPEEAGEAARLKRVELGFFGEELPA